MIYIVTRLIFSGETTDWLVFVLVKTIKKPTRRVGRLFMSTRNVGQL